MLKPFVYPLLIISCVVMFLVDKGEYFQAFCAGSMLFSAVLMIAMHVKYSQKKK
jgi:hypothetical protein